MPKLKKILILSNPLYWPAWLGLGLLWLITQLPLRKQLAIGKALGKLLYSLPTQLKHITLVNIQLCFPDLTPEQQHQFAKKNFMSVGMGIIETAMAWWLPDHKLQQLFSITGFEHIERAYQQGKGIILLAPHFTCLEIIGRLVGMKYSFAVMYRPHKKPFISFLHEAFRQKYYNHYIPSHRVRELIRTLNKNMAIWYAYDIDGGKKHSVFAPFFGVPTASLTAVSRIAELSGAAIVPISFFRRDDETGYEIKFFPALDAFPGKDVKEDATRLNAALELAIREKPEQYVWQYKRFKTRPPGEPRLY